MNREMVRVNPEMARAIFKATGKTFEEIGAELGYSRSYISAVAKTGNISLRAVKTLKAICGIDLEPAAITETKAPIEPTKPVEEPEATTITVRIELTPETVSILENYSYERTTDIARLITAINRLADAWK